MKNINSRLKDHDWVPLPPRIPVSARNSIVTPSDPGKCLHRLEGKLDWVSALGEPESESVAGGLGTRDRVPVWLHDWEVYSHQDILLSHDTNVMI